MTRERLQELFACFRDLHITVVGDLFIDRWWEIDESLNELSLETGEIAYQVVKKRSAAGAAGTILNTLSEMGVGTIEVVSMVGDDGDGWEMLKKLNERRVNTSNVIISEEIYTPAYVKPLFPREGNRFDIKNFKSTPCHIEDELIKKIEIVLQRSNALILLDQVCEVDTGVLTTRVRSAVGEIAKRYADKLIYADSRAFIHMFKNVVIKCNQLEAARMTGRVAFEERFDRELTFVCMDDLRKITGKPVIITCGANGVAVDHQGEKRIIPAVKQPGPIDVCGAGDACSAGMVTTLCAGGDYIEAAFIGNLCSGVTIRKIGMTGTANQKEMLALYDEQWKENGEK